MVRTTGSLFGAGRRSGLIAVCRDKMLGFRDGCQPGFCIKNRPPADGLEFSKFSAFFGVTGPSRKLFWRSF